MSERILFVVGESLVTRTVKKRGVPTKVHEREFTYKLACGHEVTRRYPINSGRTVVRAHLRSCEKCEAAQGGEAA